MCNKSNSWHGVKFYSFYLLVNIIISCSVQRSLYSDNKGDFFHSNGLIS